MSIGDKIKLRRIELGWSQQKLAEEMGYTSKSTITRIEKGYNDVSQKHIVKFAMVLGVSIAYLMDWEEDIASDDKLNEESRDSMIQKIIEKASTLTQDEQQDLLSFAGYLQSRH